MNAQEMENLDIVCPGECAAAIWRVMMALPDDVAQWVVANITFVDFSNLNGLACHVGLRIESAHRVQRDGWPPVRFLVIVTHHSEIEFTIAHEIAHHWCGHYEGSATSPEEYELQEQQADALANSWGFSGQSVRVDDNEVPDGKDSRDD